MLPPSPGTRITLKARPSQFLVLNLNPNRQNANEVAIGRISAVEGIPLSPMQDVPILEHSSNRRTGW